MRHYILKIGKLSRKLPIISIAPNIKIASFNLLGDRKLVEILAKKISAKLNAVTFDYLVGPEVKVVPLLHELSKIFNKDRYIVCRKNIHGYMLDPLKSRSNPELVINGEDVGLIKGKRVVILDDVVTSGRTIQVVEKLMELSGAIVVSKIAVFKQQSNFTVTKDLIFLYHLPVFTS